MTFTPKIRKAIYAAAAAIVPLFSILGLVNEGQAEQILAVVAASLSLFASLMAIKNVPATRPGPSKTKH